MQGNVISAVFDSRAEAERAIQELRTIGVDNDAISIVGRDEDGLSDTRGETTTTGHSDEPTSFIAKAAAGSGIGALLGVAALAIPGVGPLAAAGAIAAAAVPGAALTGTAVGAAAGGLGDLLSKHGVSDEDSRYYGERINDGGIFVSVDASRGSFDRAQVEDVLYRSGGHSSTRTRMSSTETATTTY
ncbi:general stress protein [Sphingomonas humi]|uniref:General stress protein 17M-like domain-containing protein n=1 Tax=Sphingomonas humi TaxID=335630 RepID=A0ABP7S564_9SPHN